MNIKAERTSEERVKTAGVPEGRELALRRREANVEQSRTGRGSLHLKGQSAPT